MSGFILYEGPSLIDGQPIVAIVTGLKRSKNRKTGPMVQTFIIRSDVAPTEALKTGQDRSICGDCAHRPILAKETGKPPCYVNVGRSVAAVFKAYKRGAYERTSVENIALALAGHRVRIGSYGDGAAIPIDHWIAALRYAIDWTGYTHQWRDADPAWAGLVMASVDSLAEYARAKLKNYRTFRVTTEQVRASRREIGCPAAAENGARVQCADCLLCNGAKTAADIVILDHARGAQRRISINAI